MTRHARFVKARWAHVAARGRGRHGASRAAAGLRLASTIAALLWAPDAAAQAGCRVTSVTNMVFTNYTPFGPGVAATSTITYSCPPPVQDAWMAISTPRTMTDGANSLQFQVYQDAGHVTVWPDAPPVWIAPQGGSVTVYGFLPAPQDAAAGSYQTTLVVSLYSGNRTDTANLAVSTSNFVPSCIVSAATLAFGNYDPFGVHAVSPLDAQGPIEIACTRNASYTVGLGLGSYASGTTRQMAMGAQRLPYELYSDAGRTAIWSTTSTVAGTAPSISPIALTVYGRIPGGQGVVAGAYSDVVQSTINF